MLRPTWLEIDLEAIRYNTRLALEAAKPMRICAVVKADGYGHGAVEVAKAALEAGVSWLAVAIPEEGLELQRAGIQAPILVLGALDRARLDTLPDTLRYTVFDAATVEGLEALGAAATETGKRLPVHLKIDTGMNRLGARTPEEWEPVLDALRRAPHLRLEGVFTHFARSDEADRSYTDEQERRFRAALDALSAKGFAPELIHSDNSAAIWAGPRLGHMARLGIALYGERPSEEVMAGVPLRPALRWLTQVVHLKTVPAGAAISYGGTWVAPEPRCIATLPLGYADGYRRCIGNRGWVLIRGQRAPVVGRVCMDQCMVDVTQIPGVTLGDEVVLLGAQGAARITATQMAHWQDTVHYEVLTCLGARLPRVYIGG